MLLNWARNRMNGPRFLPSGRRFGPYFRSRAEASTASSPFSSLVASCFTTSSADIACHVAATLSVLSLIATLMALLRWIISSLSRTSANPRRIITRRLLIMAMFALRHVWTAPWQSVGAVTCPASHRQIRRPYWQLKRSRVWPTIPAQPLNKRNGGHWLSSMSFPKTAPRRKTRKGLGPGSAPRFPSRPASNWRAAVLYRMQRQRELPLARAAAHSSHGTQTRPTALAQPRCRAGPYVNTPPAAHPNRR